MRSIFRWIFDPYLDVLLIGAAVAWFSMSSSSERPAYVATIQCSHCLDYHEEGEARCAIAQLVAGVMNAPR